MDQRADFAVDGGSRQTCLEQRDGLTAAGEQREACDEQIQRLDMRHRIMTIGKAGGVDTGQLVHGCGRETAVIDEAYRQSGGATQIGAQLRIDAAYHENRQPLMPADRRVGAEDSGGTGHRRRQKDMTLLGHAEEDFGPGAC